jgi:hypothetical protein
VYGFETCDIAGCSEAISRGTAWPGIAYVINSHDKTAGGSVFLFNQRMRTHKFGLGSNVPSPCPRSRPLDRDQRHAVLCLRFRFECSVRPFTFAAPEVSRLLVLMMDWEDWEGLLGLRGQTYIRY